MHVQINLLLSLIKQKQNGMISEQSVAVAQLDHAWFGQLQFPNNES